MVKSVLFDFDGTLLDRDTSIQQFITAQNDGDLETQSTLDGGKTSRCNHQ
ncbi:hypothetical protein [Nostoc sp. 106C]|nr:hypothetical protein [Nostoc sp. 106C]